MEDPTRSARGANRSSIISPHIVEHAATYLTGIRKLKYNETVNPDRVPRSVDDVWKDIVVLFDPLKEDSEVVCPQTLKKVMSNEHESENTFNISLFNELRESLDGEDLIEGCENADIAKMYQEPIVFKSGKFGGFAAGIAREANGEQTPANKGVRPVSTTGGATSAASRAPPGDSRNSESGVVAQARLDHCSCLLARDADDQKWEVEHCLSVIELKMVGNNSKCAAFERNLEGRSYKSWLNLTFTHGAIAQVMLYTMAWVVPSLAKLGQLANLGGVIPWAVVVGKVKPKTRRFIGRISQSGEMIKKLLSFIRRPERKILKENHWVSGNIYVPRACGDHYMYAVTGYERFPTDASDVASAHHALSIYLETVYRGLVAAKNWLDALQREGKPCPSVPTSGLNVMIGNVLLTGLTLRGRVGRFGNPVGVASIGGNERPEWMVSQGEIFTGTLNIHDLTQHVSTNASYYLPFSNVNTGVAVAVKVSSVAVHNYLTTSEHAWGAFVVIKAARDLYVAEQEKYDLHRRLGDIPLTKLEVELETLALKVPAVSDVLLAVYMVAPGLITIMADLTEQNYTALLPTECKDIVHVLWQGFLDLVRHVLLPMSELDIIHPDIRPGFDETANILCKVEGNVATMKIIDFESLVLARQWTSPKAEDSLYIERQVDAKVFLWWQCLAVACAWKLQRTQKEMAGMRLEDEIQRLLKDPHHKWIHLFFTNVGESNNMSLDLVKQLQGVFSACNVPTAVET